MKTKLCVLFALLSFAGSVPAAESDRTPPKPLDPKMPAYPAALTDTGISGSASIELVIQTDGSVEDVHIKSSDHPAFGDAALAAVTAWRFSPGMKEGVPVAMRMSIPFNFKAPFDQQLNARLGRKVFQSLPQPAVTAAAYGKKVKLKKDVEPVYPRKFIHQKLEETVEVSFVVAPDGTTLNPIIAGQARREFKISAIFAIAQCIYEPPVKDGQGVYVEVTRKISFTPPARRGRSGGDNMGGGDDFGGGGFGGGDDPGSY